MMACKINVYTLGPYMIDHMKAGNLLHVVTMVICNFWHVTNGVAKCMAYVVQMKGSL